MTEKQEMERNDNYLRPLTQPWSRKKRNFNFPVFLFLFCLTFFLSNQLQWKSLTNWKLGSLYLQMDIGLFFPGYLLISHRHRDDLDYQMVNYIKLWKNLKEIFEGKNLTTLQLYHIPEERTSICFQFTVPSLHSKYHSLNEKCSL